jgi:hypothetical protein
METKILEIIKEYGGTGYVLYAQEITSHIMEFIEWLKENCEGEYKEGENKLKWKVFLHYQDYLWLDNKEVYLHWLNNVKK